MAALKEIEECHLQAMENGEDSYLDPRTGYSVFTSRYLLSRRKCCASKCRHCPYKHEKVKAHECTPEACPFQPRHLFVDHEHALSPAFQVLEQAFLHSYHFYNNNSHV